MIEETFEVKSLREERFYVRVFHDFLRCEHMTTNEKMLYIALKSFINFKSDSGEAYPTRTTLARYTSMSEPRVTKTLKELVRKGYVKVKHRGLCLPNLYLINDCAECWQAETPEQVKEVLEGRLPYSDDELIAELRRRGKWPEDIKKEPVAGGTADGSVSKCDDISFVEDKNIKSSDEVQEEAYSMDDIKELYHYELLLSEYKISPSEVDAVFAVLYDALNSSGNLRINGQDKPCQVVKAKLLALDPESIAYSIRQYKAQKDEIRNPKAYLLSILYAAKEQMTLDYVNQVAQKT